MEKLWKKINQKLVIRVLKHLDLREKSHNKISYAKYEKLGP